MEISGKSGRSASVRKCRTNHDGRLMEVAVAELQCM